MSFGGGREDILLINKIKDFEVKHPKVCQELQTSPDSGSAGNMHMQNSSGKKTQNINTTTVKYLFIECLLGEAIAQQCFCAEQDTRPETGRAGQQQLKFFAVAAHHNFLRRVSLNQDFI